MALALAIAALVASAAGLAYAWFAHVRINASERMLDELLVEMQSDLETPVIPRTFDETAAGSPTL